MKKDKPLQLEDKINAIITALNRIEARQLSVRRVIVARRVARVEIPPRQQPEEAKQ